MKKLLMLALLFILTSCASRELLIIDGVNNHNCKETTRVTKATLLQTGKFEVDFSTSPV